MSEDSGTSRRDDDLSVIAADDALLDALGRGEPAPAGDKLAGLVATWRSDLDDGRPADVDVTAMLAELGTEPELHPGDDLPTEVRSGNGAKPVRPTVPGSARVPVQPVASARRGRWRPSRRARGYLTGVAAALVLIAGLATGAGRAGPDSPLWPIARVLYPERADLRLAEHTIARAREAAADGRYNDARRTLDKAANDVRRIDDATLADRLRAQIDEIRRTLPPTEAPRDVTPPASAPSTPLPSAAPPTPTGPPPGEPGGGGQPGGGEPGGGQPGGGGEPGGGATRAPGGGIVPPLPTPTLPIPVPTLPIPDLPVDATPDIPGL